VTQVTWNDAVAYCRWLSLKEKAYYRLPTEAEWEFACRAGSEDLFFFGNDAKELGKYAWFGEPTGSPHPVATKLPNAFGLYDMHGNAWEWCQDFFPPQYTFDAAIDPMGPLQAECRATRGSFWYANATWLRCAARARMSPLWRGSDGGFRIVRVIAGPTTSASPPVDLLSSIDLDKDTFMGNWRREGSSLVTDADGNPCRLQIRHPVPAEYELTAEIERPESTEGFIFGLIIDAHPVALGVDCGEPARTGLVCVDRKLPGEDPWTVTRAVLTNKQRHTVAITVKKRSMQATLDGQSLYYWEGDPERLSLADWDKPPDASQLWIGTTALQGAQFHKLELRSLDKNDNVEPGPGSAAGKEPADSFEGTQAGDRRVLTDLKMAFRWCPPGSFTMGSPTSEIGRLDNESPVEVTLSQGFWLAETEVTQGQWERLMGTTFWKGTPNVKDGADYAVSYITYDFALNFVDQLTNQERKAGQLPQGWRYALPTEAQWEYACRAGTTTRYGFGDNETELAEYAWYGIPTDFGESYAHEVGKKKANAWGLKDMHGNLWEWCADWYSDKPGGGVDPAGPAEGSERARKGGGWGAKATNCRSASRNSLPPDTLYNTQGFRVAIIREASH
jgi:formylglycine-generating enzyme required for sulfatase activity